MSSPLLQITTGTSDARRLKAGDVVPSEEAVSLDEISRHVGEVADSANALITELRQEIPGLTEQARTALANVNAITGLPNQKRIEGVLAEFNTILNRESPKIAQITDQMFVKSGFYEFHRWATNPRQMITQFVADSIRTKPLFKTVALQDAGIEPAYVLSGNIERLEEVDQGRDVSAVSTISAQLVNAQTMSVVWSHTASETVSVSNRDMAGVVSSLSDAVQMTVDPLVESMEETLAAMRKQ